MLDELLSDVFKATTMGDEIKIRPKSECRWDLVSLGEVMLRLDRGDARIATTRTFRVWEGGGEYNVARCLRRCFGSAVEVCFARGLDNGAYFIDAT